MKSAPAAIASTLAWRIWSYEPSSPVSRITFRCAGRAASRAATISSKHSGVVARRGTASGSGRCRSRRRPGRRPRGSRRGARSSGPSPLGNAPATLATLTPVPPGARAATGTSCGYTHTAATRDRRVERVGPDRLRAQLRRPCPAVSDALERRQVHAPDRQVERPQLRLPLDRALREGRGALLQPDGVDGGHPRRRGARRPSARRARGPGPRAFDLGCLGHRTCHGTAQRPRTRLSWPDPDEPPEVPDAKCLALVLGSPRSAARGGRRGAGETRVPTGSTGPATGSDRRDRTHRRAHGADCVDLTGDGEPSRSGLG